MNLYFFYIKTPQICPTNPAERGQRRPCFVENIALLMSSQRFVKWKRWQIIFLVSRALKSLREKWFLPLLSLLGRGQAGSCASFINIAPWCRSHKFGYRLHLPLPALAGQPGCNVWQSRKSLLCCHHSKVIRFALPGIPVSLYLFSLSVVGYKNKQTGQHLLDMRSGRAPRISLCGLGTWARGAEKSTA